MAVPTAALLRLTRTSDDSVQTTGELAALSADGRVLGRWHSLERPWLDNAARQSCVPPGRYRVVHRTSAKFKAHLHVTDVPGRSYILVHAGNTVRDVVGCVLVGTGVGHVDADGRLDVTGSRDALGQLLRLVPPGGVWMDVHAPPATATGPAGDADRQPDGTVAGPRPTLRMGDTGRDVEDLQRALVLDECYVATVDGDFGPRTRDAVKRFQRKHRLLVDGVAGRQVWLAIEREGL